MTWRVLHTQQLNEDLGTLHLKRVDGTEYLSLPITTDPGFNWDEATGTISNQNVISLLTDAINDLKEEA